MPDKCFCAKPPTDMPAQVPHVAYWAEVMRIAKFREQGQGQCLMPCGEAAQEIGKWGVHTSMHPCHTTAFKSKCRLKVTEPQGVVIPRFGVKVLVVC